MFTVVQSHEDFSFARFAVVCILIFMSLLAIYSPVLAGYYAHGDDYIFWGWDKSNISEYPQFGQYIRTGRVVGLGVIWLASLAVDEVKDLNKLRLVSLSLTAFCGAVLFFALNTFLRERLLSYFIVMTVFTLPPFGLMMAWGVSVLNAAALALAAVSAYCTGRDLKIPACIFLILSLAAYQPAAMFYWVIVFCLALNLLNNPDTVKKKKLGQLFLTGIIGILFYVVLVKILLFLVPPGAFGPYDPAYNLVPTQAWGEKFAWFVRSPLLAVLNLWNIKGGSFLPLACLFFVAVTLLRLLWENKDSPGQKPPFLRLSFFALWFTTILLSSTPSLLTPGKVEGFRVYIAFGSVIVLGLLLMVIYWVRVWPHAPVLTRIILVVIFMAGAKEANSNVYYFFIKPNYYQLEFFKQQLSPDRLKHYRSIVYWPPSDDFERSTAGQMEFRMPGILQGDSFLDYKCRLSCVLRENGIPHKVHNAGERSYVICRLFEDRGQSRDHYLFIKDFYPKDKEPIIDPPLLLDASVIWSKYGNP